MTKAILRTASNPCLLILFCLGMLNAVHGDWLNAGVWTSIASGGLACELYEQRRPGALNDVWRKVQWASVAAAALFAALMVYTLFS